VSCKLSSGAGPDDDEDDLSSLPSGSIVEGGDRTSHDSSISSVGSASSTTSKVDYF
jgi:hypothetical protein